MHTFLRRLVPALLAPVILLGACPCDTADAQDIAAASRLWGSNPSTRAARIRVDRREFYIAASIVRNPVVVFPITGRSTIVPADTDLVHVSIQSTDGKFLPTTLSATKVTLLVAGRPIWRGSMTPFYYPFQPLWIPPGGWGEYAAGGVPSRRENERLVARVTIQSGRGSIDVDIPVIVPSSTPVAWRL